jgi:DNA-binding transcriptional ArsR family regulator
MALLADPTRLRIVGALALRPRRPSVLAHDLRISRSVVSRQLRLLRDAGLVAQRRSPVDGRWTMYAIEPSRHGAITAWLAGTEIGRDPNALSAPAHGRSEKSPEPAER